MSDAQWLCTTPQLNELVFPVPFPLAIVLAPTDEYELDPRLIEQEDMSRFHASRRRSFLSGRYCAMRAQELVGITPACVRQEQRMPVWPSEICGSITHADDVAAAVVSLSTRAVGIDIELRGRVEERIYRHILTEREHGLVTEQGNELAELIFSAKEAGYKATYPLAKQFIGFREAEVDLDIDSGTFRFKYVGDHAPSGVMEEGIGFWKQTNEHTMTVFVIP